MSTLETPPAPTPARPVRIGRFLIGVNVLFQLAFAFGIVLLVNYVSFKYYKRWDFSHNQKFALSQQTKNVLTHLDAPVHAIVFFPQAQALSGDVNSLLREYEYASNRKFAVEQVDPYRNLLRARELSEKYKFGSNDNIVILDYKGKSKFVNAQDMAEIDNSGAMFGQPPTMKAFKGEEAVTSALMEITEEKQNKLYVVAGHGETDLNNPDFQVMTEALTRQNVKTAALNLGNVDAIPADATGLLVVGAKTDFSERDLKLLSDFWNDKKGRLFIMLNPLGKTPRLNDWLASQGVTPQNDRVLKTGMMLAQDENGQVGLKNGVATSPMAVFVPAGKAVTKDVAEASTQLLGATESLLLDRSKTQTDKIQLIPLMEAAEGFWGSTTYSPGDTRQVFFDPKKDHQSPLTLGVAVEKGALDDARVKVDTARMIIIGNSGFLSPKGVQLSEVGVDFALNATNWMFNREEVAGIAPKKKEPAKLNLDEKQMGRLFLLIVVGIPGLVALVGTVVWWQRRS